MLLNFTMTLIISMILVLFLSSTPLNLGLWIILTTLIISTTMTMVTTSWFSFILFLIYIGGLLVMFAYFTSIQPNQQTVMSKMFLSLLMTMILFTPFSLMCYMPSSSNLLTRSTILEILLTSNIQILLILAMTLFLALIAVVKMTKMYMGPLRPYSQPYN